MSDDEEEQRRQPGEEGDLGEDSSCLPVFISKLLRMLSPSENADAITWGNDGTTVLIRDRTAFESKVIPKFFKHSNLPSFVRQLNLYGFHKTTQDPEVCEFQHKYFKRDQLHLLHNIRRKQAVEKSEHGRGRNSNAHAAAAAADESTLNALNEIRVRQSQFEASLLRLEHSKELEKQMIFQAVDNCHQRQRAKI